MRIAVSARVEERRVVQNPLDRQLDHAGGLAVGVDLVGAVIGHERRVVQEPHLAQDVEGVRAVVPGRGAVAERADAGDLGHVVDGTLQEGALVVGLEAGVEFVDPAVNGELVVSRGLDDVGLEGVEDQGDGGNEEGGGDAFAVEQVDDAGQGDACSELALREGADGGVTVAQAGDGLVVHVEGEEDRDAGAAGPGFGLQAAAGADCVDGFQDSFVGPAPAGFVLGGLGGGRLAGPEACDGKQEGESCVKCV